MTKKGVKYVMMKDLTLIRECLKGNGSAQRQLYDTFSRQMLGVCYRYTKNFEDAEDILQEGFIKAFKNLHQYKGDGELGGWIRRIMVNSALDFLKRKYLDVSILNQDDHLHPISDDNPEINLDAKQLIQLIHQLPVAYQTIFNLHAIEGYSHVEIGEKLGIKESTCRSQYMRARNLLVKGLNSEKHITKKNISYATGI